MALTLPQPFGKYLLVRKLAVGGMAEIFLAKSRGAEGFQRDVVIKRILPSYSDDEAFVTMFIDEARIAARLHHPNIVQIYDFAKEEDSYYIAMEYVDGRDLRKVLDRGLKTGKRMTHLRAMHVVADIAAGLKHAHAARGDDGKPLNVVHRDVSPHNILIAFGGEGKIFDFGIAKAAARSTKTRAGTVKGKCSYMSPEQARGKPLDGRSDMFALCAIAWEILAGRKLFEGDTDFEILNGVLTNEAPPPSSLNPEVPPDLDAIILKGLAKDRDQRYPDMAALEKELRNFEFRHAQGLDEVALGPYLADLFADEIPVHSDVPREDSQVAAAPDHGTIVLPEGEAAPQAAPRPIPTPAPLPGSAAPTVPETPRPASGHMPKTIPVGGLQGELEDYLAKAGTGTLTPSSGTSAAPPSRPIPGPGTAPGTPVPTTEPTPVKGPEAGATPARGTSARGTGKNITLPLSADEVETELAKPPPSATPVRPIAKSAESAAFEPTPSAVRKAGGKPKRTLMFAVLGLVGLAAAAFIVVMLMGRGGEEPAVGRSSAPAATTPAPAPTPPVEAPPVATPPVATPTPPVEAPPVEKTPAPTEAKARPAVLTLQVDPAVARVLLDGKAVPTPGGQGRIEGTFNVGDQVEVTASAPGRKPFRQTIRLASEAQAVPIRLEKATATPAPATPVDTGFVTINARPWADVYWKGRKVGTTPLRSFEVPVGSQVFVLKNQVTSKDLPVTVEKGKTTSHVVDVR